MVVFGIVAALFVAGALLWLLPGLLRPRASEWDAQAAAAALTLDQARETERDAADGRLAQERLDEAQAELAQRAREEAPAPVATAPTAARRTAIGLALVLPLVSAALYLQLGEPQAIVPTLSSAPGGERHTTTPEQIEQRVAALAERLRAQPGDIDGWLMLGRSYTVLGRYRDAATAMERASALAPQNAGLLADWADVLAMSQGRRLTGRPAQLIQRALDADPRHVKALALAGSVAFETKDYAAARGYWEQLLAVVPADSPLARSVQGSIAEASALDGSSAPPAPASANASIAGQVELSPALAARVAAGDTLFVFARAVEGPRMPLAIYKVNAHAQPARFVLDDSMAMAPALRLSGFKQVIVGARISRSGQATPQAGDLIGQSGPLAPGAQGVRVVIDRVQP